MSKTTLPSKEEIIQFETAYPMLLAVLKEIKELSKKKQDGFLNEFKAKAINKILSKFKSILRNEPSVEFLELLDEETLPSNSDAVLVLVQFQSALGQFKTKYQRKEGGMEFDIDFGKMVWNTED